jgi:hypothetical protein
VAAGPLAQALPAESAEPTLPRPRPAHAPLPTPDAATPDVAAAAPASVPGPEVGVDVASPAPAPLLPVAIPEPAPVDTSVSDAEVRRIARTLIEDLQEQIDVPPYLSFRESRIQADEESEEEIRARRDAARQASERIVSLLATLRLVPPLREAVQSSLGVDGRARMEQAIVRSFQSLPDAAERERALKLWNELEAAAAEKR